MSNFNASQDYRGFTISNSSGGGVNPIPPELPNPFDEINVKTLNIVSDENQPFYTFPREENLVSGDGALTVFNADGSSSLQAYTQPAYFYMSNSSGGADVNSRGSVAFTVNKINSLYNITRVDDLNLTMPKGTYLCSVNFSPYVQATPNNVPRSSMYFSADGATDTNPPFYFQKTYNLNEEFLTFNQIIIVDSPTQQIRLEVDNRNNTAGDIIITSCNVSITKIAPNFKTNLDLFLGQFYANQNYTADSKQVILTGKPKEIIEVPYNLISIGAGSNTNTQVVQDGDGFNILELSGISKDPYTLQFAGTLGFSCYKNDFLRFTAVFQQSVNSFEWHDIDNERTIYINGSQDNLTDVAHVPISLNKYNYIPIQNTNKSYIRVLIKVYPNAYTGTFPLNSGLYFNNSFIAGRPNSMISIFKLFGTAETRYLMATNGNGQYLLRNYTFGIPEPDDYIINGVVTPLPNSFTLFPMVINNKLLDISGNGGNSRIQIEYPTNNLSTIHGSTFCWLVSEVTGVVNLQIGIDILFENINPDTIKLDLYQGNEFVQELGSYLLTTQYYLLVRTIITTITLKNDKPTYFVLRWLDPTNNPMLLTYGTNTRIEIVS
jgi:hypothetical protein